MKINIWLKSILDKSLQDVLELFSKNTEAEVVLRTEDTFSDVADLEIILGSWKLRNVPHHNLKRDIVKNSKNVLVIETPLLLRGPQQEIMTDKWFRVGLNGFMRNAQYAPLNNKRMSHGQAQNSISSAGAKGTDYILVVLQLPGDASLDFIDINKWCIETVQEIRKHTDRDIVIRYPQLDREFNIVDVLKETANIYYQKGTYDDRKVTLDNAYCVITYSSGMGVEAILNGNRTYIQSDNGFWSKRCSISDVLDRQYLNFSNSEQAQDWIKFIESTQWHMDEIKSGECLKSFMEILK